MLNGSAAFLEPITEPLVANGWHTAKRVPAVLLSREDGCWYLPSQKFLPNVAQEEPKQLNVRRAMLVCPSKVWRALADGSEKLLL